MQVANIFETVASPQGIIEMHGAAAHQQKNMLDALAGDKVHDVMRKFNGRSHILLEGLPPLLRPFIVR
jgi:hypothetical protein